MIDWSPYIEPSDGASPEHVLWTLIPQEVRDELRDYDRYPPGAYALYCLLCQAADGGLGKVDLVEMVNRWAHPDHPDGPPIGLSTITHVLDCAGALERGGFLRRVAAGTGNRWTVLERGEKRTMPDRQAGPDRVSIKQASPASGRGEER